MAKRKIFQKIDLAIPGVKEAHNRSARTTIRSEAVPPPKTSVDFPQNPTTNRSFDFARWYGAGIDEITHAYQRQIERFLAKQDNDLEVGTVVGYCTIGGRNFLEYMIVTSAARRRRMSLADINRDVMDGYLSFLASRDIATLSQRAIYETTKLVLLALGRRELIQIVNRGATEDATFPPNPFPGANRKAKGEVPLAKAQRRAFTSAVKAAAMPLFEENADLSPDLLAYALLVVALHTGRNTTPLLELSIDCLCPHPRDDMLFLMLHKRRGHATSQVVLQGDSSTKRSLDATSAIKLTVARLIQRIIALTADIRASAPLEIRNRLWIYRVQGGPTHGQVTTLSASVLLNYIARLVSLYDLTDTNGQPLRINVSRLRKTFVNRIYEILDGDVATTAAAPGNTTSVTEHSYLRAPKVAQTNWKFMGQALVSELLANALGNSERTPTGHCTDTSHGEYAPKVHGAVCFSFLNCLRCRNYVVTGDDLYRLFSFYWRVLGERSRMDARLWERKYSQIPRLIDRDVVEPGIRKKIFKQLDVDTARERARVDPHPFWALNSSLSIEDLK